jgi:hypothetical protein
MIDGRSTTAMPESASHEHNPAYVKPIGKIYNFYVIGKARLCMRHNRIRILRIYSRIIMSRFSVTPQYSVSFAG